METAVRQMVTSMTLEITETITIRTIIMATTVIIPTQK